MLYNMSYPHDQLGATAGQQPVKPVAVAVAAAARPRQRCSQPMPFDPEELSQKLAKVLADQKLHAERRRRARAEAAAAAAPPQNQDAVHPPHPSMAREFLDQGSIKPGNHHSTSRPRGEPAANKPAAAVAAAAAAAAGAAAKDGADPSTSARPKSKASEEDRRSSKSGGQRKGSGEKHPYIPQFAASQFARTTTSEGMSESMGLVRKLSRTALRIAQGHRERHTQERNGNNNDVQHDRIPEAVEADNYHRHYHHNNDRPPQRKNYRHTIEVHAGAAAVGRAGETDDQPKVARRLSTGDLLMNWDSGASSPNPYGDDSPEVPDHDPYEHRVDWTQSDERPQQPKPKPSLRKSDSLWALKQRLGALTKHGRGEEQPSRNNSPPSGTPRSPKSGFFARFKVNH